MMLPERRRGGIEELCWSALTGPELQVVADLLATLAGEDPVAHLDIVIEELRFARGASNPGLALAFTPRQNRGVAEALQRVADRFEIRSDPLPGRAMQFVAGYVRTLADRLIRGHMPGTEPKAMRESSQLLLKKAGATLLLRRDLNAGRAAGSVDVLVESFAKVGITSVWFRPLAGEVASAAEALYAELRAAAVPAPSTAAPATPSAASKAAEARPADADDELLDFQISNATQEMRRMARGVFDEAIKSLGGGESFPDLLHRLHSGQVEGLEKAAAQPVVVGVAANTALTIATLFRQTLRDSAGLPREALLPGLKAIIDRYPGLKKSDAMKGFLKRSLEQVKTERELAAERARQPAS
jgi:hypothetical protein